MKEYIDKNKAQIFLRTDCLSKYPTSFANGLLAAADQLNKLPTADVVEVRHGEWHYNPDGMDWGLGAWECSLCRCTNKNLPMDEKINPRVWAGAKFCPNCGAKMDGEKEEQG